MRCLSCGQDVPYDGKVCPWCHADKSSSQNAASWSIALTLAAGGAAYFAFHTVVAIVVTLLVGSVFFGALVRIVVRAREGQ